MTPLPEPFLKYLADILRGLTSEEHLPDAPAFDTAARFEFRARFERVEEGDRLKIQCGHSLGWIRTDRTGKPIDEVLRERGWTCDERNPQVFANTFSFVGAHNELRRWDDDGWDRRWLTVTLLADPLQELREILQAIVVAGFQRGLPGFYVAAQLPPEVPVRALAYGILEEMAVVSDVPALRGHGRNGWVVKALHHVIMGADGIGRGDRKALDEARESLAKAPPVAPVARVRLPRGQGIALGIVVDMTGDLRFVDVVVRGTVTKVQFHKDGREYTPSCVDEPPAEQQHYLFVEDLG